MAFYDGFLTANTLFAETDPMRHAEWKRMMKPIFLSGGVLQLESVSKAKILSLDKKVEAIGRTRSVDANDAFRCELTARQPLPVPQASLSP